MAKPRYIWVRWRTSHAAGYAPWVYEEHTHYDELPDEVWEAGGKYMWLKDCAEWIEEEHGDGLRRPQVEFWTPTAQYLEDEIDRQTVRIEDEKAYLERLKALREVAQ